MTRLRYDACTGMDKIAEIMDAAKSLSAEERRQLVAQLSALETGQTGEEARRRGRYAALLALSGTVHSDFTDISTDKYPHVGASVDPDR